MPLLYKNQRPYMKDIKELTLEEAKFIFEVQPLYSFTESQAKEMVRIVRDYYDPNQPTCSTCGSGLRPAKDSIVKLYKENELFINQTRNGIVAEQHIPYVEEPVVIKTPKKNKK